MKNLPLYVFPFLSFSLMAAFFPFFAPGGGEKIATICSQRRRGSCGQDGRGGAGKEMAIIIGRAGGGARG